MGTAEVKAPILVAMRSIRRGLTTNWALCYVLERPRSLDSQDSPPTEWYAFPSFDKRGAGRFETLCTAPSGVEMGCEARQTDSMVGTWSL